jgi:tellurite resistance protein TerC
MISQYLPQIREAAPVVISLIIIQGLLSVDNMLAIAALANSLPANQKKIALRVGLAGAYAFRCAALPFAGFIMKNEWVNFLGAFYLIHLMAAHFSDYVAENDDIEETVPSKPRTFWQTVIAIQLMDLSLSVDNIVASVAMSRQIWVVFTGVFLGLVLLFVFATLCLKLVEKFPILEHTAFLLIGYVGLLLLLELSALYFFHWKLEITTFQKFIGILAIIALSLWYARHVSAGRTWKPLFLAACVPLVLYAKVVDYLVLTTIFRPFKILASLFRRS